MLLPCNGEGRNGYVRPYLGRRVRSPRPYSRAKPPAQNMRQRVRTRDVKTERPIPSAQSPRDEDTVQRSGSPVSYQITGTETHRASHRGTSPRPSAFVKRSRRKGSASPSLRDPRTRHLLGPGATSLARVSDTRAGIHRRDHSPGDRHPGIRRVPSRLAGGPPPGTRKISTSPTKDTSPTRSRHLKTEFQSSMKSSSTGSAPVSPTSKELARTFEPSTARCFPARRASWA